MDSTSVVGNDSITIGQVDRYINEELF